MVFYVKVERAAHVSRGLCTVFFTTQCTWPVLVSNPVPPSWSGFEARPAYKAKGTEWYGYCKVFIEVNPQTQFRHKTILVKISLERSVPMNIIQV